MSRPVFVTRVALALCALASSALAACGDPLGPRERPALERAESAPALTPVVALRRLTPLDHDITVTATLDGRGGTLEIPEAGLRVKVPTGAVAGPTEFKITALAGDMIAYQFEPHGTRFGKALEASQELRGTTLDRTKRDVTADALAQIEAAYFPSPEQLDAASGTALVEEFRPTTLSLTGHRVRWSIWHFSGYMVSSARCR